jgi:hypothetical protein
MLAVVLAPVSRAAEDSKSAPTLVVRIQSLDDLYENIKYLAGLVDQDESVKQTRGLVESMVGEKGLKAFDTKRPIGLYGQLGSVLTDSSAVLMLPVSDEKAVIALLERFDLKAEADSDGVYLVKKPEKLPDDIYFRFANKYIYATMRDKSAIAKDKLIPPEKVFVEKQFGVMSFQFRFDQIPEDLRNAALTQIEVQFSLEKDKKVPGETAAQHELKGHVFDEVLVRVKSVFEDGEQMTVKFDVDREKNDITVEANLTAKKGTKLAGDIADFAKTKSLAAAVLSSNAALSGSTRFTLPKELAKELTNVAVEQAKKDLEKQKDETARRLADNLLTTLLQTLKSGEVDLAFELRGPGEKGKYTLVGAGAVKEGKEIEKSLRDIVKSLPEDARERVKLDIAKEGATAIHSVDIFKDSKDDGRRVFGDGLAYVAIRQDAMFVAVGEDGLSAIKAALKAPAGKGVPLEFSIALARLGPLMEKDQPSAPKVIEEVFGKTRDADRMRFVIEGGPSLKVQIAVKGDAIRFLARMAEQGK